ncbi:MAG: hypothetical protein K0Q94_1196 [Paenibacillus sp.]|jgi:hypothetical protein|uniref:hypothetical protein n=1 Tax=Paenibacillus sp. GCM10012303 TaxID=3317340 RepID=UPI0029E9732D|nr:hypothetical protein [Paenibacillus sp.]
MSEFSNSFHLKTFDQAKAVTLLRDAEMTGYVYGEENGWVTFVVEHRGKHADKIISKLNPGILVHHVYLEDHMWALKVYKKDELMFDYEADWAGEGLVIEKRLFDLEFLDELVMQQGNSTDGLEQIFDFKDSKISYDNPPAYLIAKKLGLSNFEWISSDNLSSFNDKELQEMSIIYVGSE